MNTRHSAEQIVAKLRQADFELGKGSKVPEVCKQLGISEQTYYRWRTPKGGMDPQMAQYMKNLERQNSRLKKLADGPGLGELRKEYQEPSRSRRGALRKSSNTECPRFWTTADQTQAAGSPTIRFSRAAISPPPDRNRSPI